MRVLSGIGVLTFLTAVTLSVGCSGRTGVSGGDEADHSEERRARLSEGEKEENVPTIRFVLEEKATLYDPRKLSDRSAQFVWAILKSEPLKFDLRPKDLRPSGHFLIEEGDQGYRVNWAHNEVWKLLGGRKARWHKHSLFGKMSDVDAQMDRAGEESPARLDAIIKLIEQEATRTNDEKKDSKKD